MSPFFVNVNSFTFFLFFFISISDLNGISSYQIHNANNAMEGDAGGFRARGLRLHNFYRTMERAKPLELDATLNKLAHAQAEKLAKANNLTSLGLGFMENMWSHRGELLPLGMDIEYAIQNWYTGSKTPGQVVSIVDRFPLLSDSVSYVGFGVGTEEFYGVGYTVVVAFYA